ncbi:MAG: hypothetical protein JNM63_06125 [Spirochaetia bacterium]|nr:hypothetical protein [Spirochaetia bacterium]
MTQLPNRGNQTRKNDYISELSPRLKKRFFLGLGVYVVGFLVLWSIGSDINQNGFIIRAFLAPFFVLSGIVFIVWNFYKTR